MRTIETVVYKFSELSEEAKQKAIENLSTINVDHEWYDSTYEDAENIGIKIDSFDIDRGSYCNGKFIEDSNHCANAIIKNHVESCDTFKDAKNFLDEWGKLVTKYSDGINTDKVHEDKEYEFDQEADELESEFLKTILEDYRIILQKDYEYQTSEEAIKESIEANECEFTENGKLE